MKLTFDTHITDLAEAKRFFQSMGCSSFHMSREYPELREKYRALEISESTEREWANESVSLQLALLLDQSTAPETLAEIHSRLVEFVFEWRFYDRLNEVLAATEAIEATVTKSDRIYLARTIVGRPAIECGLVVKCRRYGDLDASKRFAKLAYRLAQELISSTEHQKERHDLVSDLAHAVVECGL